jgi:hypothetical protein
MREILLLLATILAAYSGCALLALSQAPHWKTVAGGAFVSSQAQRNRSIGSALLVVAVLLALWRDGVVFGLMMGFFLLAFSGFAVAFTIACCPAGLKVFLKQ